MLAENDTLFLDTQMIYVDLGFHTKLLRLFTMKHQL
jgi:hypothetical protein